MQFGLLDERPPLSRPRHRPVLEHSRHSAFTARLIDELRHLPGVTTVGATSNLPLTGQAPTMLYAFDGKPEGWVTLAVGVDTRVTMITGEPG
jgi:hypothetical protein